MKSGLSISAKSIDSRQTSKSSLTSVHFLNETGNRNDIDVCLFMTKRWLYLCEKYEVMDAFRCYYIIEGQIAQTCDMNKKKSIQISLCELRISDQDICNSVDFNPFPNKLVFLRVSSSSLLKTLLE